MDIMITVKTNLMNRSRYGQAGLGQALLGQALQGKAWFSFSAATHPVYLPFTGFGRKAGCVVVFWKIMDSPSFATP